MNIKIRRFLALNAVLNGHPIMEAFDNDIKLAMEAFNADEKNAKSLIARIDKLQEEGKEPLNDMYPEIRALLNFYRGSEHAIIIPSSEEVEPISVQALAAMGRDKESELVDENIVCSLISNILYVVEPVTKEKDVRVSDGALYMMENNVKQFMKDSTFLSDLYMTAFLLLRDGPYQCYEVSELLLKRTDMDRYKELSANMLYRILDKMCSFGVKPTEYTKTCLNIPDLLPVYKYCGAVIMFNPHDSEGSVYWLMDTGDNFENSKVIVVDMTTIAKFIAESPFTLTKVGFKVGAADGGLVSMEK